MNTKKKLPYTKSSGQFPPKRPRWRNLHLKTNNYIDQIADKKTKTIFGNNANNWLGGAERSKTLKKKKISSWQSVERKNFHPSRHSDSWTMSEREEKYRIWYT